MITLKMNDLHLDASRHLSYFLLPGKSTSRQVGERVCDCQCDEGVEV